MSAQSIEGGSMRSTQDDSPTCASPSPLSPTLTQSPSNSSSSPPGPSTPRRGSRTGRRYPEDLGRVPLHRRGTSNTYERLEDLLKEAGYKETRIFTPETERLEANGGPDGDAKERKPSGMDTVVGFFAGFIPGSTANKASEHPASTSTEPYSPPHSPLAHKRPQRNDTLTSQHSSTIASSIESLHDQQCIPTAAQRSFGLKQSQAHTIKQTPSNLESYASHQMHKQPSRQPSRSSVNQSVVIASPRPSRAGAYLRHMASVSNMLPERPNSTPVNSQSRSRIQLNEEGDEVQRRRGSGDAETENEPPLPPTWLETVARAVLFGGNGAYIGGPTAYNATAGGTQAPEQASTARVQVLRPTRSSLSQVSSRRVKQRHQRPESIATPRNGLVDQTNSMAPRMTTSANGFLVPPPPLFSQIERGRASTTEGTISKTRVVCRSAPGSRSASIVRSARGTDTRVIASAALDVRSDREKLRSTLGNINATDRRMEKKHKWNRKSDADRRLPSLARTQVEGDFWSMTTFRRRSANGWGAEAQYYDDSASDEHTHNSSSEEDDGELDLARLLVPPKRQQSIRSLRKHLSRDVLPISSGPSARPISKRTMSGDQQDSNVGTNKLSSSAHPSSTVHTNPGRGRGYTLGQSVTVVSGRPPSIPHPQPYSGPSSSSGSGQSSSRKPRSLSLLRTSYDDGDGDGLDDDWGRGWVKQRTGRGTRSGTGGTLESDDDDDDVQSFKGFFGEGRAVLGERDKKRGIGFAAPWLSNA
ncbi:hypothetical protein D9619_010932 [Psilocybe cf. subviscida]|uniref:Uncharacterized protein n=1 Tax=Psilocybe cf. subviscida TaxID=2480587 RepID=A0A8H5B8B9_9AGAR|nr:hypothetical protein D9619_010932 [Psilocybe cf. subviscida]